MRFPDASLRRRPIALMFLFYLCGATVAYHLVSLELVHPRQLLLCCCSVCCLTLVVGLAAKCRGKPHGVALLAIWLAWASTGAIRASQQLVSLRWPFSQQDLKVNLELTVVSDVARRGEHIVFTGRLESSIDTYHARGKLVAVTLNACPELPAYGDSIQCTGYLSPPRSPGNPGEFDQRQAFAASGVWAQLRCSSYRVLRQGSFPSVIKGLFALKRSAIEAIDRNLCPMVSGLVTGMLFGGSDAIEPKLVEPIRTVGVAHVLAVSGLHVNFIRSALRPLTKLLNPREYSLCAAGFLAAYAIMAGMSPSILRAFIMTLMDFLQVPALRNKDPIACLAGSGLVICLFRPMAHLDLGFQLSYLATLGVMLSDKLVPKGFLSKIPALSITLGATAFAAPVVVAHWNSLALISPISNLLLVPLAGLLVPGGLLIALLSRVPLVSSLVAVISTPVDLLGLGFILLGQLFATLPLASVSVATPSALWLCSYYALVSVMTGMVSIPHMHRRYAVAACSVAVLVATAIPFVSKPFCAVTFLDVGQGDCVLIQSGSQVALVDTGPLAWDPPRTLAFLRREGITRLDYLVVTHWHQDHAGAVPSIMRELKVEAIVCPELTTKELALKQAKVLVPTPREPLTLDVGHCKLEVVGCVPTESTTENQHSLLAKLSCGPFEALLTADLPVQSILGSGLVSPGGQEFKVLKAPHHGAADPRFRELLDCYKPNLCVISVGVNSYGHPSESTLRLLNSRDVQVYRTDRHGAVFVVLDRHGRVSLRSHRTP
ncbi:MAG: DNA internalization-related competence protein ComEC/Rec2 [Bacillota bacterium]